MKKIASLLVGGIIFLLSSCSSSLKEEKVENQTFYAVYQDTVVKIFRATDGREFDLILGSTTFRDALRFGIPSQMVVDIINTKSIHRYIKGERDDSYSVNTFSIILLLVVGGLLGYGIAKIE